MHATRGASIYKSGGACSLANDAYLPRAAMVKRAKQRVVIVGGGLEVLNGLVAGVSHSTNDGHVVSSSLLTSPSRNNLSSSHTVTFSPPPPPARPKMSVSLNPSNALGFRRPLTTLVKRSLTITNNNPQPVAFKVKTTAPKLYCVRPNSGRVEPGESIDVSVMLQALKEEPPMNTKCKDKFLIQSTIITPDKETLALHDLWASPETNEEGKVFQQKLRVTYLPAEGQTLEEEDESTLAGMGSTITNNDSHYDTLRHTANGHTNSSSLDTYTADHSQDHHEERSHTPAQEPLESHNTNIPIVVEPSTSSYHAAPVQPQPPTHAVESSRSDGGSVHNQSLLEESEEQISVPVMVPTPTREREEPRPIVSQAPPPVSVSAPVPVPPVPVAMPVPIPASAPVVATPAPEPIYITKENPINEELYAKYNMAQAEIERLKGRIAELSSPAAQELRRRTRKLSDVDTDVDRDSLAGSDIQREGGLMMEDMPLQQDGVPLQVVVIIAVGVFVMTYLFF